jgi:predicted aconitase with swiveling domain
MEVIQGRPIVPGMASGEALVTNEPLSFWGGYDAQTGEIIDRRHPLSGQIAAGKVLILPFHRGSSTTTAMLLEALRAGTAPAAILTTGIDPFFALASIVGEELFDKSIPIVSISKEHAAAIHTGQRLDMAEDGTIRSRGFSF